MLFLIFSGIVSLVFGVMLLGSPDAVKDLSKKFDKALVRLEEKIYTLRKGIGLSMVMVSFMIFYVVYYLVRKY